MHKHIAPLFVGLGMGALTAVGGLAVIFITLATRGAGVQPAQMAGIVEAATAEQTPAATPQTPAATAPAAPKKTTVAPKTVSPATVLNLKNWKLTLPVNTDHAGSPDEITQPELASFSSPNFRLNEAKNGVIFQANAGGATTKNSGYPRSELREMNGSKAASWSNKEGAHTMVVRQAITHLPVVKPEVVSAQIHDSSDDVIMIKLSGKSLFVEAKSKNIGTLDSNYTIGTAYTVKIVAANGKIQVFYNDALKADYSKSGSGYYFKTGCYTQSNTSKGDAASAYGEVVIYDLSVSHS